MSILDQGIEYDDNNIRLAEGVPTAEQGEDFKKHFLRIESHHLRPEFGGLGGFGDGGRPLTWGFVV